VRVPGSFPEDASYILVPSTHGKVSEHLFDRPLNLLGCPYFTPTVPTLAVAFRVTSPRLPRQGSRNRGGGFSWLLLPGSGPFVCFPPRGEFFSSSDCGCVHSVLSLPPPGDWSARTFFSLLWPSERPLRFSPIASSFPSLQGRPPVCLPSPTLSLSLFFF